MSREPLALIESVSKTYSTAAGVVDALHAVDAMVPRAAITTVTGVSGSGKSTLLRLLAGQDTPTTGRLVVAGRASADWATARSAGSGATVWLTSPSVQPTTSSPS